VLKLRCDELRSKFAFKFNLRRYTVAYLPDFRLYALATSAPVKWTEPVAGAYTHPLFCSTWAVPDTKHTPNTP
jgi:hypothetical protein